MSKKYGFSECISAEECESLGKDVKKYNFSEYWSRNASEYLKMLKSKILVNTFLAV